MIVILIIVVLIICGAARDLLTCHTFYWVGGLFVLPGHAHAG